MTTLRQLIDTVGEALVDVVVAPKGLDREIRDVLVHDPTDPLEMGRGDLVLGVGLSSIEDVSTLLKLLGRADADGLVLKSHIVGDNHRALAEDVGLALLSVHQGASWSQLLTLLQAAVTHGGFRGTGDRIGEGDSADLFELADAIAALVDAPITIEDRLSRVVAFSGGQDEADEIRTATILGRRVPAEVTAALESSGIFERLAASDTAVYFEDHYPGVSPRLAIAVRAGDEILGYLWAACKKKPTKDKWLALEGTAKIAALHLLRHRAGADIERRIEADLVASALSGGGSTRDALLRLGLPEAGLVVMIAVVDGGAEESDANKRVRLRDMISSEFSAARLQVATAVLGGVVCIIAAARDKVSLGKLSHAASQTLERARARLDANILMGVGAIAETMGDLPRSYKEAEAAARVLRAGRWNKSVGSIDDVRVHALLLRLGEVAAEERDVYLEKIAALIDAETKGSEYLETLQAFFDAFGDIGQASKRLMIHPNTLRYRLSRIQEIAGIDLSDPEDRLAIMIILAAFRP